MPSSQFEYTSFEAAIDADLDAWEAQESWADYLDGCFGYLERQLLRDLGEDPDDDAR